MDYHILLLGPDCGTFRVTLAGALANIFIRTSESTGLTKC